MKIIKKIENAVNLWKRQKAIKIITTIDPEKLQAFGEKKLIEAFYRAAKRIPAYKDFLRAKGVDPSKVTDVASFKKLVPFLTKAEVFPVNDIDRLCLDGSLEKMESAMTSSGFSGVFSYGIITEENNKSSKQAIDTAFDYIFQTSKKKTLIINCVPMGVKIPTGNHIANTSVRSDMALSIFRKFSRKFDQAIFVSDPHFLKKLLEDGLDQGIDWKKENVHLVSGEDWFSESLRSYLCDILGTDWDNLERGIVGTTMGVAELDLNILHESIPTMKLRRAAEEDPALHRALFGDNATVTPLLMHYYPHKHFIESLPIKEGEPSELVFTILSDTNLMPLVRYNSKDEGTIFTYRQLEKILLENGYPYLIPEMKLPVVALGGRRGRAVRAGQAVMSPELARSLLYKDFEVARSVTGNFLILNRDEKLVLEIQLRKGVESTPELANRCAVAFQKVPNVIIRLISHFDFHHCMTVDYETKFRHVV